MYTSVLVVSADGRCTALCGILSALFWFDLEYLMLCAFAIHRHSAFESGSTAGVRVLTERQTVIFAVSPEYQEDWDVPLFL